LSLIPSTRRCPSRGSPPPRALFTLGAAALLWIACDDQASTPSRVEAELQDPVPSKPDAGEAGADKTATTPLQMPHHQITRRLGAHRIRCRSTLSTAAPRSGKKRIEQEVNLRVNKEGHFAGTKNTHEQYGQEVIWTGDWLYTRLRYSDFTRRRPEPEEPPRIADRMAGLLPAYARLLGRFMALKPAGQGRHLDRDVVKLTLARAPRPRPAPRADRADKKWRETIAVTALKGTALLDAQTRVPLSVKLEASWTFTPPAGSPPEPTGIPTKLNNGARGTMELRFSQEIAGIGEGAAIKPPPRDQVTEKLDRVRLELERQMLTEERPIDKRNIRPPRPEGPATGKPAGAKK